MESIRVKLNACLLVLLSSSAVVASAANKPGIATTANTWSPAAAVKYMDAREVWWQGWPPSQRDHNTVCISCHTVLPYALARPTLKKDLGESGPSKPEQFLLSGVIKRVGLWSEVAPFYQDGKDGPGKSAESRGTEAVLNALVLSSHDAQSGQLEAITRTAFENAWKLQLKSGENAGAWDWLNFHLSPWESDESQYFGAALAAVAAGIAPDGYLSDPKIQDDLNLLRSYLKREYDSQPLANKVAVLWASAKLPGILTPEQRTTLIKDLFMKQQDDGGWTLTTLGTWKRHLPFGFTIEKFTLPRTSDGYATGLSVYALEQAGISRQDARLEKGLAWLQTKQDKTEGGWPAFSLNDNRNPSTPIGHFMKDAATAYAVLALEKSR